jgi:hypothetical protein
MFIFILAWTQNYFLFFNQYFIDFIATFNKFQHNPLLQTTLGHFDINIR